MISRTDTDAIAVTFSEPIPLMGLHSQQLGVVKRCRVELGGGIVTTIELQTQWQRIQLTRDAVRYDPEEKVFRLIKQGRLTP
jgi:hypothetical protein